MSQQNQLNSHPQGGSGRSDAHILGGAVAVVVLWFMFWYSDALDPGLTIAAVAVLLTYIGVGGARIMASGRPLGKALVSLQLGPLAAVGFTLVFGLATLVWYLPETAEESYVPVTALPGGAAVAGLGMLVFTLAYRAANRAEHGSALIPVEGKKATHGHFATLLLFVLSQVGALVSIASGRWGYLSDPTASLSTTSSMGNVLSMLSALGLLSIFMAAWRLGVHPDLPSRVTLFLVLGPQIALGLFSGMKQEALVPLLVALLGYGLVRRFQWRRAVAMGLFAIFVVTPFIAGYREAITAGGGRLTPAEAFEQIDYGALLLGAESRDDSGAVVAQRLSRVAEASIIVEKTPETVPYADYIELFGAPLLGVVPRSLWPSKPVLDAGYEVMQNYYARGIHSSAAVTLSGDLWRHGGVAVLVGGMALLGLLIAAVDRRPRCALCQPQRFFLPLLLVVPLVKQEIDFVGFVASLPTIAIIAAVAGRLVAWERSPGHACDGQSHGVAPPDASQGDGGDMASQRASSISLAASASE